MLNNGSEGHEKSEGNKIILWSDFDPHNTLHLSHNFRWVKIKSSFVICSYAFGIYAFHAWAGISDIPHIGPFPVGSNFCGELFILRIRVKVFDESQCIVCYRAFVGRSCITVTHMSVRSFRTRRSVVLHPYNAKRFTKRVNRVGKSHRLQRIPERSPTSVLTRPCAALRCLSL